MSRHNGKLKSIHRQRQAYVYIRQSTWQQVLHHQESGRRQYALQEKAVQLGWSTAQLVLIDEDQTRSGKDSERAGFRRLMQAVSDGRVGTIFCLEVSRLARRSSAWHALIEVCAWQDTLLIGEEVIYDPTSPDDRLLLGLRGLIDENELETLRRRMQVSREQKAQRGELRFHPPTGFVHDRQGGFRIDPDEEIQGAMRLLLAQFRRLGSAAAVVRYFADLGLLFPTRHFGGARDGEVTWKSLTYGRVLYILHDPIYAGAYTYGRHAHSRQRKPREKQHQGEVRLPQEQWLVLIWDAFPGYISREEYEANQQRLRANRAGDGSSGIARPGAALLGGLVVCGVCGRRLKVKYEGSGGQYVVYACFPRLRQAQYHTCQRVPGNEVDQSIARLVLDALTPAEIELSLQVLETMAQQQVVVQQQWERHLERARYEADLARRRYLQVDPANRLVARTLEQEWESCLATLSQTEQAYAEARQAYPLQLSASEREQLLALAHDLPALWQAETTTLAERKELLRLLVADVTLTRWERDIRVQLRWVTNVVEEWTVPLSPRGARTQPAVITRLRELSSRHTDAEIAEILNEAGLCTARGYPFTAQRVHSLRRTHRIIKKASRVGERERDTVTLERLPPALGQSHDTLVGK